MSTDLEVSALLDTKDFSKAVAAYVVEVDKIIKGEEPKVSIGPLPPPMSREGVNGLYLALRRYEIGRTRIK